MSPDNQQPLAEKMRPLLLQQFVGQSHLLSAGMPLANIIGGDSPLHSMILWGPPGCGKTTLARALAHRSEARWFSLSAVTAGLREVRAVIEDAKKMVDDGESRGRVLFVDEAHHFNKSQQDAFLPHVESGLFLFIGSTTENPSFELNRALLSRLSVYVLSPLDDSALAVIAARAVKLLNKKIDEDALAELIAFADGDARRLLNVLEKIPDAKIDAATLLRACGEKRRRFDKGGDNFYEQISALHKSIRGSAPDAALYWLCRMLDGGADAKYIGRRLIRVASEDIGLADARALSVALDADAVYRRLGSPEGELALAQAAVYLACVPKSDAVYRAFGQTMKYIKQDGSRPVPQHLCNAPTALMAKLGNAKNYRHAHDEPNAYAAGEVYFPDKMRPLNFYKPTNRGLESKIANRLKELRSLDEEYRKGG